MLERIRIVKRGGEWVNFCNKCGKLKIHVGYDEGNNFYCPTCAFSFGAIDEDQLREDLAEEKINKD